MSKKKYTKDDLIEATIDLTNLLDDDFDVVKKEASDIFNTVSSRIDNYLDFSKGINNQQEWVEKNRIIYGRQFSYEDARIQMLIGDEDKKNLELNAEGRLDKAPRPYLMQYINDKTKDKNCIKCRQSELTETEINDDIYLCASRPYTNVRHIFPTSGVALKMSKEKISTAIEKSPRIFSLIKRPYSLLSKSFYNGSFYTIDSSWTDYQGRGPSSDKLVFDEYESQNPQIEDIFSESTSHSGLGRKTRISTPKFPNSGIDLMFNKGCGFIWHVTCPKCKKEQVMSFPESIINFFDIGSIDTTSEEYIEKINKAYIGCKFCAHYFDRISDFYIRTSRWVALKPHLVNERSSYRITYFMLPWKTGKEILYKYHTFKFLHQFYNEVVGSAYLSKEAQITREIFEQCQDRGFVNTYQKIGQAKNISVGVDWGNVSWVVIRANGFLPDKKKSKVIYIERIDRDSLAIHGYPDGSQTDHVKRVSDIIDFYRATVCVNDANGIGVDRNAHLVKKYPTRAYGAFYDTDEQKKQKAKKNLIIPMWNEGRKTVTVSRVGTLKMMIQEYEEKKILIPRLDPDIEEFIKHHANLVIEKYEDQDTGAIFEVVGKTGADHYAHADNYAKIGFERLVNTERDSNVGVINSSSGISDDVLAQIRATEDSY